jgi:hypothetical protein
MLVVPYFAFPFQHAPTRAIYEGFWAAGHWADATGFIEEAITASTTIFKEVTQLSVLPAHTIGINSCKDLHLRKHINQSLRTHTTG